MSFSNDDDLCREFLATWPIERLRTMTLPEYSSASDRGAFAYWIEFRLQEFGSIKGGSAFKFGVFARNADIAKDGSVKGLSYDAEYGWYSKFGETSAQAFQAVRALVVKVAEAARAGRLADIDAVDLGDTYKWKIAFHYQPIESPSIPCIFQRKPLLHALGLPLNDRQTPLSTLYRQLGARRSAEESIFDFSGRVWHEAALALPCEIRLPEPAVRSGFIPFGLSGAPFPESMHGTKDTPAPHRALFRTDTGLTFESDVRVKAPGKGVLRRNLTDYFRETGAEPGTVIVITPEADGSFSIRRKGTPPAKPTAVSPAPVDPPRPLPPVRLVTVRPPLNQILFGPPGTGKTFHAIDKALEILDPAYLRTHATDRVALKARFDTLAGEGLVQFVTFHQSFSYEDFVEGLRAESDSETGALRYEVVDGVFKRLCEAAQVRVVQDAPVPFDVTGRRIWKLSLGDALTEQHIYRECIDNGYALLGYGAGLDFSGCATRDDIRTVLRQAGQSAESTDFAVTAANAFVLQVKPGDLMVVSEGNLKFRAIGEVTGDYRHLTRPEGDTYAQCRDVRWLRVYSTALPIERLMDVRFSQATIYELREGSINLAKLQTLLQPQQSVVDVDRARVLIIDEINRGNVSRIFGELITLIEPSKRAGAAEALTVTLPYSKTRFSVPANVHLIGTMNTADRSLAGVDIALRRRFQFVEMPPRPEYLNGVTITGVNLAQLLTVMNHRIEQQIVPLLQEYFFEDWERIGWVLNDHRKPEGCRFVVEQGLNGAAMFGDGVTVDTKARLWRLDKAAFDNPQSYRGIIATPVA
ncbi:MAG: AAA family ATPase [Gemmatimonadaceae bacterium]|nr:AAA family ATPase [Gemmatimonadaceae bacterium]